jgi:lipopolysaccharide export system permease protein
VASKLFDTVLGASCRAADLQLSLANENAMNKLQRYYFAQTLPLFLLIMAGLTLVALLSQSLSQLDLLFERGQSAGTFLGISLLATPQIMSVIVPIGLFAAVTSSYARMHQDNEIITAYASGWTPWQVAAPAFRLAIVATLLALTVNLFVQPAALREMRERLFTIRSDFASMLVREGEFRSATEGLMIYAQKIERSGLMTGMMISDNKNRAAPVVFVAQTGQIAKLDTGPIIQLKNGSVQRRLANGDLDIVGFSTYVFELKGFADESLELFYKPSDRYMPELLKPDMTYYWDQSHVGDLYTEANRRLASPLLCFAAVGLALFAVLGGAYSRHGYSRRIVMASAGLVVMLLAFSGILPAAANQPILGLALYILPLLVVFFTTKNMRKRRGNSPSRLNVPLQKVAYP